MGRREPWSASVQIRSAPPITLAKGYTSSFREQRRQSNTQNDHVCLLRTPWHQADGRDLVNTGRAHADDVRNAADSSGLDAIETGLNTYGRAIVMAMNETGMVVDGSQFGGADRAGPQRGVQPTDDLRMLTT
jgi:hypothetical protein